MQPLEGRVLCATVAVNLSAGMQMMEGVGGNYARGAFGGYYDDATGRYTAKNLNPGVVRVPILLNEFEPANDNADPRVASPGGFKVPGKVDGLFKLLQQYQRDGRQIEASLFDIPAWMARAEDARKPDHKRVGAGMLPELAEGIAAWVRKAKDGYGVNVRAVSVNESDGGYRVQLTAGEYASVVKDAGARFAAAGLGTKWMIGDSYFTKGAYQYAKDILAVPGVRPYAAAISYHSWWSETEPDSTWTRMRDLGKANNLPVWCTEAGTYALAKNLAPQLFGNWEGAMRLAKVTNKIVRLSGASQLLYWQYQDDYPLMTLGGGNLFPSYYVVRDLSENLKAGAQVVSSTSDDAGVLPLAAKDVGRGRFFAQAINAGAAGAGTSVTFTGLPDKPLTVTRNSAGQKSAVLGTVTPIGGKVTLVLPGDTITTLSGALGVAPGAPRPPAPQPPAPQPPVPPAPAPAPVPQPVLPGAAVTLLPTTDAIIRGGAYAGTPDGAGPTLAVKHNPTAGNEREAYLGFDLSALPQTFTSAKLRVFGAMVDGGASATTQVYAASGAAWGEGTLTWNTRLTAGLAQVGGPLRVTGTTGVWYEVDLTGFLTAERAAGHTRVTFVLRNSTMTTSQTLFGSREGNAGTAPQIVVS